MDLIQGGSKRGIEAGTLKTLTLTLSHPMGEGTANGHCTSEERLWSESRYEFVLTAYDKPF